MKFLVAVLLALVIGGCQSPTLPDPNDFRKPTSNHAQVLRNNLRWASDAANLRVAKGEITQEQADKMVADYAAQLAKAVQPNEIDSPDAWKYGELFLAAKDWKMAETALKYAVAHAKNEDRRVNDSLRLAQVEANLENVPEAIRLARSTFSTPPPDKPPILPAVLLAIVPAAEGKGHDKDLAALLLDAVKQHEQAVVDTNTTPGKMFLIARKRHLANAEAKAAQLSGQHSSA